MISFSENVVTLSEEQDKIKNALSELVPIVNLVVELKTKVDSLEV